MTERVVCVLAPRMHQSTNKRGAVEPQIWFRLVHQAPNGRHRTLGDGIADQNIEITLGPRGAFKKGNVGAVTREAAADWIISALPESRGRLKPLKEPKTPRVVELLKMAVEWRRQLDEGEVETQAAIARREGITRARVTQIMALLRLAPEIREHILTQHRALGGLAISERALRPVLTAQPSQRRSAQARGRL